MSDSEEDLQNQQQASPTDPMELILAIQKQQLTMQEQMTALIGQIIPNPHQHVNPDPTFRRTKPERPIISADCSDNKWIIFLDAWQRYKQMSKLTDPIEIRNELRSACDTTVNEMLFNFVGPQALSTSTEDQLLTHIKSVAVKTVHPEVYRQQFYSMRQQENESITRFISRLKSQAMLCDFVRACDCTSHGCKTSYSEDMLMSQIITGLMNPAHQSKILSDMVHINTLQSLTERLLTLESTTQATSHFKPESTSGMSAPIRSDYQRSKGFKNPSTSSRTDNQHPAPPTCNGCGRNRHPKGRRECPAQGKACDNCGKLNHLATVCRSAKASAITNDETPPEDISFISSITNPLSL